MREEEREFKDIKKYACEIAEEELFTNAFPFFCLRIHFNDLSKDEIFASLEGLSSNDDSIDAFWINEYNKTINIAQFKSIDEYYNINNQIKKETMTFLDDVENKLLNDEYIEKHTNKRIKDISLEYKEYKHKNYSINKYMFHLGFANESLIEHHKNIKYVGYKDIKEKWNEYNSINSLTDPEECSIIVSFNEFNKEDKYGKIIRFRPTQKYSTVVTLISGTELIKLREKYKYQLFDRNVRHYLGSSNKINKEIYNTAKNKPDNFYYFNNGITITCSKCKESFVHDEIRLTLELPQIINGAQTVNAIYEAYNDKLKKQKAEIGDLDKAMEECNKHFSKIKVLCRIIESTKHAEANFSMDLTKYNNSQNSVNIADFFANRPELAEIQDRLLNYGYFFEKKRGEREKFKTEGIFENNVNYQSLKYKDIKLDLPVLAGLYQAFKGKPSSREVGDRYILDVKNDDYQELFGKNKSDITNEKIKEIVLAINIFFSTEQYAKDFNKLTKIIPNLIINQNKGDVINKFKDIINKLTFLPKALRNELLEGNYDLIERIYQYRLLSQGKYIITAIINEILEINKYKDKLFTDNLFCNYDFIKNNIVSNWLAKVILKLINPVRDKEKDKRSDNAFFLDQKSFENIKGYIKDLKYNDDYDMESEFPLIN